jgi:membrane protease YdiL (CAAX protease family)
MLTDTPLAIQANWQWLFLSALLINGLVEETMMRGFVFRRLRGALPFWHAAALSTVYFAGYHLLLIFTLGVTFGVIGVLVAIPAGFLTAYIYERGNNTIWGSAVLHSVNNGMLYIFVFLPDIQAIASALYLLVSIVVSIMMLSWAYRERYGRLEVPGIEQPSASSASFRR